MPAPKKDTLANLAKKLFTAKAINLPVDWSQPGDQYPDAFEASEKNAAPNSPTNLFKEATLNKYHVDTAKTIGEGFEKYIDGICDGICSAIDNWMNISMFTIVIINGPVGTVTPGSVVGPPLLPFILSSAPMNTPQEIKYSLAIANGLSNMWLPWHMGLSGVLSYPSFSYFAGPVGPPTPNTPQPLISLASPGETGLSAATLKNTMMGLLGDPQAQHADPLFDSISSAFNTVFQTFKASTMVQNVMGTGPIPSFVPPFSPGGPVVGGAAIPAPGVFK